MAKLLIIKSLGELIKTRDLLVLSQSELPRKNLRICAFSQYKGFLIITVRWATQVGWDHIVYILLFNYYYIGYILLCLLFTVTLSIPKTVRGTQ